VIAAETRTVLDLKHDWMLKQIAAAATKKATPASTKPPCQRDKSRVRPHIGLEPFHAASNQSLPLNSVNG
jgi:hypothetical protein